MSDDTRSTETMESEQVRDEHGTTAVEPAGHGGELEPKFANPGLPVHRYRRSDVDPKAAKRREREVATFFGLSTIGTIVFIVGYLAIHLDTVADVRRSNLVLGIGLGIATFCIGVGAIHWAKTLMPDDEIVNERHVMRSSEEDREAALDSLKEGAAGAGLGRRKLIRNSLLGALGPLGLLAILPLRDLGPLPGNWFSHTVWKKGTRLATDPQGRPIKASDVPIGGVVHVLPEGIDDLPDALEQKVKAAVILIRLAPQQVSKRSDPNGWGYDGIVAYSIICTHVGCPVGLYEQKSHRLLCPCHQSTFDVLDHCKVVFGPAVRPLPQLPITVDDEGYLIAQSDFHEPVGPSFWERG
jgi:quinol---cytochrome c reductase iron-sulfur subunit